MASKRKQQSKEQLDAGAPLKKRQKSSQSLPPKPPIFITAAPAPFFESPRGADLKREVELYEQLSSQDSTERLEAANAIVSGLLGGEGVQETVLERHLERRLFRGLASGRKGARLGFSVVLTELLSQLLGLDSPLTERYSGLTFEKVLGILIAKTKPEGDLSGQEQRDHAFGLLFGLQIFVRAKILFENEEDRWNKVFDILLQLAMKKPWIREECGWVVVEALEQMDQSQAERTLERLQEAGLAASPEGVGVWLTARRRFPDMKFPSKPWGRNGNPLNNLKALAKALKESSSPVDGDKDEQAKQTGHWNPKLHFAWDMVLDQFLRKEMVRKDSTIPDFENFWKVAVDGGYSN